NQHFFNECVFLYDYQICWSLMNIPYNDYMQINPDRFYEVMPVNKSHKFNIDDVPLYNGNFNYYDGELVEKLKRPSQTNKHLIFAKLTRIEAIEYLNKNGIDIYIPED